MGATPADSERKGDAKAEQAVTSKAQTEIKEIVIFLFIFSPIYSLSITP
jgi:hypothetical protein